MIEADETVVRSVETRQLKTELTRDERAKAGEELANTNQEIDRLDSDRKAAAESFKHRISEAEAKRSRLADIVASGHDWRSVDCERVLDYDSVRVTVARLDTGEVIENRDMYESEKQRKLPVE